MNELKVGTWVAIDEAPTHAVIVGDVVEISFGNRFGSNLDLQFSPHALEDLVRAGGRALADLQARQSDAP